MKFVCVFHSTKSLQCQPSPYPILCNQFVMHKFMAFVDWFTRCIFLLSYWICLKINGTMRWSKTLNGKSKQSNNSKRERANVNVHAYVCTSAACMYMCCLFDTMSSITGACWRALKFLVFNRAVRVFFLYHTYKSIDLIRFIKGYHDAQCFGLLPIFLVLHRRTQPTAAG